MCHLQNIVTCEFQESVTTRHRKTHGQTDAGQSDLYACATMLFRQHKKINLRRCVYDTHLHVLNMLIGNTMLFYIIILK